MLDIKTLTAALNGCNDGVIIAKYDPQNETHPIVFANRAYENISGYQSKDLLGQPYQLLINIENTQPGVLDVQDALRSARDCAAKLRNYTNTGRPFWNQLRIQFLRDGDHISHFIAINRDVTQEEYAKSVLEKVNVLYREMSKRLEYTNETDSLTQLKNRGHLSTRGEFILGAAKREKLRLHAILVDVEGFDLLISATSSEFGDQCLVHIADVIRRYFCRTTDIAIRLEDDEFVILCIEDDDHRVIERAEMLRTEVLSLELENDDGEKQNISVNIGVYSVTPSKSTTIEEMVENAGQLVFQSSCGSRGRVAHACANSMQR